MRLSYGGHHVGRTGCYSNECLLQHFHLMGGGPSVYLAPGFGHSRLLKPDAENHSGNWIRFFLSNILALHPQYILAEHCTILIKLKERWLMTAIFFIPFVMGDLMMFLFR